VDGVVVATPTHSHYEIAKHFLEKGVNLLVEKPITSGSREAEELLSLAKEKDVVLHVGHVERFNPAARRLFEIKEKPNFIRAQRLSPFTGRSLDIDVVQDLMIHDLEIVLSLLREEPQLIHASGVQFATEKLDFATAILRFPSCVVEVTASRIYDKKLRRLDAFFPSGLYVKLDFAQNTFARFRPTLYGIEEEWTRIVSKEPLRAQMERFIEAIKGRGEKWDFTAVRALGWAEKISKSAERGF
jgi:predicted dehydrogenase